MINALPAGTPDIYYHGINLYADLASIIIFIAAGLVLFRKNEEDVEYFKRLKMAWGIDFVFFATCKILWILAVWFPDYYDIYVEIGYVCGDVALFPMIYVNEHHLIKKTRHVFSIIILGMIVLMILGFLGLFERHVLLTIQDIMVSTMEGFVIIIYMYLAFTSTGVIRKDAVLMITSLLFMSLGILFDTEQIVIAEHVTFSTNLNMVEFLYSVPSIFFIIAVAIFSSLQRITATAIDFYTNKRVCIVHKGEIKGKMFICSKCNAYYCLPCKEAIEQIDKCCWNCKTPFDQSTVEHETTLSEVEPSKENSTPEIVSERKNEALETEPGKGPAKGVVAGQEPYKAPKKKAP